MLFAKLYLLQRKMILRAYGPLIVFIPTLFLPKLLQKKDLEKSLVTYNEIKKIFYKIINYSYHPTNKKPHEYGD